MVIAEGGSGGALAIGIEMDELLKLRYERFRRMGTFVDDGIPPGEGC